VIVDDVCLEGCAKAVADYRQANAIADDITVIDWTGIYWKKRKKRIVVFCSGCEANQRFHPSR